MSRELKPHGGKFENLQIRDMRTNNIAAYVLITTAFSVNWGQRQYEERVVFAVRTLKHPSLGEV